MVNLERALKIDGWMNGEIELPWLARQASKHKMIAEVGSYLGRSTRAMADNTNGLIFAVDTWKGTLADEKFPKEPHPDYFYQEFTKNLGDHLWNGTVTAMRMSSLEAAAHFAAVGAKFDFVFLDSAHDYESVRDDILAWRPLLAEKSLLALHDYDWGYPGTVQAVRELLSPTPMQVGGSSLCYLET